MQLRSVLCVFAALAVAYCQPPPNITTPNRDPENYTLTFRDPPGCDVGDCVYFAGIDINTGNPDYLDIYIEGDAGAWVALGFSDSPSMFSADVLACNLLNSGTVEVLDTWNLATMTRDNVVDMVQDVTPFSGNAVDGRIICTFARLISGSDVPLQDLDLSQDYFVLYGANGDGGGVPGRLVPHTIGPGNPRISATRVNAANLTVMGLAGGGELPPTVIAPDREPLDYRILARTPAGCSPSSCDVFVGIDNNTDSNYLDIYMEGNAEGWLAVGFTRTNNMFDADVLACNVDPITGMVEVLDGWNIESPGRNNVRDQTFDTGVFSTNIENGRITCTFARRILGTDIGTEDWNLNEPYFILYGRSPENSAPGQLVAHQLGSGNPFVSSSQVNPETDEADIGGDRSVQEMLTRAHGILMIIAWPVMAVTAIFFAAWMRPALPNGEWFQVHRAFMLGSLFVGTVGFILIFAAQYNRSRPGLINLGEGFETETAHFSIGIIVMALQIANPIIALVRCHPGTPNRWIFNLIHGTVIGLLAEILALVNVGIGLSLFGKNFSRFQDLRLFYVYLSWEMFLLVMIVVLFIIFTILAATSDEEDRKKLAPSLTKALIRDNSSKSGKEKGQGVELAVPGQKPPEPPADQPKLPSDDAPLRWAAFIVFGVITIPIMLALIVLVGLPQ